MNNESTKTAKSEQIFLLIMFFAMVIWGSSWISAKIITHEAPPEVIVFWRLLITFASFIPIVYIKEKRFVFDKKALLWSLVAGTLLAGYNQLFFLGLKTGLPGKGGIIVTTLNPLFTFLITITILKHRVTSRQLIGLSLGVIGSLALLQVWNLTLDDLWKSGNLFFIISAFGWAALTVISQQGLKSVSFITFSFYMYGVSALVSYFFSIPHDPLSYIESGSANFWWHMIYLSVIVVSFATTMYFFATDKIGSNRASSFTFLVPFTAVGMSWYYFGEQPQLFTILGGVLALLAIWMINKK